MRCPLKGGQTRLLQQVPLLLLWLLLLLRTTSCQVHSVTPLTERPLASITHRLTSTTGPGASIGKQPSDVTVRQTLVPDTASLGNHGDGEADVWQTLVSGEGGDIDAEAHYRSGGQPDLSHTPVAPPPSASLSRAGGSQSLHPSSLSTDSPSLSSSSSSSSSLPVSSRTSHLDASQLRSSPSFAFSDSSDIYSVGSSSHPPLLLPSLDFTQSSLTGDLASTSSPTPSLDGTSSAVLSLLLTSSPTSSDHDTATLLAGVTDIMPTPSLASGIVTSPPTRPPPLTYSSVIHIDMNVTEGDVDVTFSGVVTPDGEIWNHTSVLPPEDDKEGLSVGATVGISVACVLVIVSGVMVGLALLYHRHRSRKLDTTKTASNHYTGLWDDNVTLSYINNHFDFFQKDAQDEMISLDNDAYLNSLEFMVFTNTWGDGKRNTRF